MAVAKQEEIKIVDNQGREYLVGDDSRVRVWCAHRKRYLKVAHIDARTMIEAGADIVGPEYGKPEPRPPADKQSLKHIVSAPPGNGRVDGT